MSRRTPNNGRTQNLNTQRFAPYVSGSAAPKRDYIQPEFRPERNIDVIPGGSPDSKQERSRIHEIAIKAAKATCAIAIAFTGIGFCRVSLAAATVAEALEAREVATQLEEARSAISDLEVSQSTLSNPTRIKTEAAAIGMASPDTTAVLDLSGDVVVTDALGNLSLTESLKAVAEAPVE